MIKVSRPILYLALAGTVVYAAVVLTEPDDTPAKHSKRAMKASENLTGDFTKEDYTAHFARYQSQGRNAFQPLVVPSKTATTEAPKAPKDGGLALGGNQGVWNLTGITALDGVQSALVENSTTNESQFLKVGDLWKGLRVTAITDNAVVFVNTEGKDRGKEVRLTFTEAAPGATRPGQKPAGPNALPPAGAPAGGVPTTPTPPQPQRRGRQG